ncbi:MAG: hypothetical protein DHS20C04_32290 [Hyphococcus sp.]|nr:MAG: hypothetical protein DHS20C04_32290 [Marinicaulis sp.]
MNTEVQIIKLETELARLRRECARRGADFRLAASSAILVGLTAPQGSNLKGLILVTIAVFSVGRCVLFLVMRGKHMRLPSNTRLQRTPLRGAAEAQQR